MCLIKKGDYIMRFLGWIFTILLIAGVGYAACHFGWLEPLFALLNK